MLCTLPALVQFHNALTNRTLNIFTFAIRYRDREHSPPCLTRVPPLDPLLLWQINYVLTSQARGAFLHATVTFPSSYQTHFFLLHSSVGLCSLIFNENYLCFATSSTYNKITRQRTMGQQMTREVRMCPMKPRRRKQTRDIQNNVNVRLCFHI